MDIEQQLSKALADPDIMNKVSSVLSSLGENGASSENPSSALPQSSEGALLNALGKNMNDDRTNLLMAIKPFLSEKRAPYMDSALTIMKLVKMGKIGKDLKLF